MMRINGFTSSAVLAATLMSVPVQAAPNRIAAPARGESQVEATSIPYLIGFLVILAIGLAINLSSENLPISP